MNPVLPLARSRRLPSVAPHMPHDKLVLWQRQCPGDAVACLAALESLHLQHPGKYATDLHCCVSEIFDNHPNVTRMRRHEGRVVEMHCPAIQKSHVQRHFMSTFVEYLGSQLGIPLELQVNHPTLYLSPEEKALPKRPSTWVINAGWKKDCEAKFWGWHRYQQVVEMMPDMTFVQVGEASPGHFHQRLVGANVEDRVGQTTARQLMALVSQVDGVLCGVTFVQHVAAALGKPCVCINLREPPWFTSYPRQTMLSSMGKLACCQERACWASAVRRDGHGNRCKLPVVVNGDCTGACATLIEPQQVVDAVRSYYVYGML